MAWYDKPLWRQEKQNPSQGDIAADEGPQHSKENTFRYTQSYEKIEVVNRGVNMIVNDAA